MDEITVKLSDGSFDVPDEIAPVARRMNLPSNQPEELPVVQGHRAIDGTIRVNESELDPGRYRVEFDGQTLGEVRVVDPVTHFKSNRADRRKQGQRGNGVHRRAAQTQRWGRD